MKEVRRQEINLSTDNIWATSDCGIVSLVISRASCAIGSLPDVNIKLTPKEIDILSEMFCKLDMFYKIGIEEK